MTIMTNVPVPGEVIEEIVASEGFYAGRIVTLFETDESPGGSPERNAGRD